MDARKHFVSYSSVDAREFAKALSEQLESGTPSIPVWVDVREINPQDPAWFAAIDQAIRDCRTMLFVISPDSVDLMSVCAKECSRAITFKKPVVPLLWKKGVTPPFLLEGRQYIDFSGAFDKAVVELRGHLLWIDSPAGVLDQLKYRLMDANRDLKRASDGDRPRILAEIATLKEDIAHQQAVIDDPGNAAQQTQKNIDEALEQARKPRPDSTQVGRTIFVNPAPTGAPAYFQDRFLETKLLGDFLKDDSRRIASVVGRGGTGKTAMVCRLLKALATGVLPDDGGPLEADGIVYLSGSGSHKVNAANIFTDLCRLLPAATAERLTSIYQTSKISIAAQMQALLEAFPNGRTIVLLDNFEDVMDASSLSIADPSLAEALRAILNLPQHAVKVIITSRIQPRDLALEQPGRQLAIQLDEGLPSPFAENVLRAMDADGTLGLKSVAPDLLLRARERTRGYPRALEALYAILKADTSTSLDEILNSTAAVLPGNVVTALVGEAYSRLDSATQQVMQALAIYGHPVPAAAIDHLLQPFFPAANCAPVLNRLVNMHFARKDSGRYYMHAIDRDYAVSRVPEGQPENRQSNPLPFTKFALLDRAADFFFQARIAPETCRSIADLLAQQIEFDLRVEGRDYDSAAQVLFGISGLLTRWGHFRLAAQKHGLLIDKLTDPLLAGWNLYLFGWANWAIGETGIAIPAWEKALTISRSAGVENHRLEAYALSAIATSQLESGRSEAAIHSLEIALELARGENDSACQASCLNELARSYTHLGQTQLALDHYNQAFKLAGGNNDIDAASMLSNNIGNALGRLGDTANGLKWLEQGLRLARQIQNRLFECANLTTSGILLIAQNRLSEAVESLNRAVDIADDLPNLQFQNEARQPLATAYLYGGDLGKSREIAEAALRYDAQQQSQPRSGLLAFLGMVALRQGDETLARSYFQRALKEAEQMLAQNPKHFVVWESKGLALCGFALCDGPEHLTVAVSAYRSARALTKDAGIVLAAERLFDALAQGDSHKILDGVRWAVGGASA